MTYHCWKEDVTNYTYYLTRKYGPLVRVQPNVFVYVSSPDKSRPIEFGHHAQFYTLDVATSATFGKPLGFLDKDGDVEKYLEITESMTPMFGVLGTLPWLVYVMHVWPLNRMMPDEADKVGFERMMKSNNDSSRATRIRSMI